MLEGFSIRAPFFEIGPKAYMYGKQVLALAVHADRLAEKYRVSIIFTPQYVDIPAIVRHTDQLYVFAQHADPIEPGRGVGSVLLEALKEAGASGILLNHAEKRVSLGQLNQTIRRADAVGLATLVCADSPEEAAAIAHLSPNMILAESPELIGKKQEGKLQRTGIAMINETIRGIDPRIKVFHSAGIYTAEDVRQIVSLGAEGTGSTSGIVKAKDPFAATEEMVIALRQAWDDSIR